jgi:hypothetical protein
LQALAFYYYYYYTAVSISFQNLFILMTFRKNNNKNNKISLFAVVVFSNEKKSFSLLFPFDKQALRLNRRRGKINKYEETIPG